MLQRSAGSLEEVGRRIAACDHEGAARLFVEEVTFALARLKVVVRLSEGSESPPLFTRLIDRLATLMPCVTREVIDGTGHVPQLSTPAR